MSFALDINSSPSVADSDRTVTLRLSDQQTDVDFPFPLMDAEDLSVTRIRGGVPSVLHGGGQDYVVTVFGERWGGTLVLSVPAQAGDVLDIRSQRRVERDSAFTPGGVFTADAINGEFNRIYYHLQELRRDVSGALKMPSGSVLQNPQDYEGRNIVLGLTPEGQPVALDMSAFRGPDGPVGVQGPAGPQGEIGPAGPVGPRGAPGQLPSVIAESQNGCAIGVLDGGIIGQNEVPCDDGDIYSLERAPGILGYDDGGHMKIYQHGEFSGAQGPVGPAGQTGPVGPRGAPGQLPSVIAESSNGCAIGVLDGGIIGQNEVPCDDGDIYSLERAPGILGYDDGGHMKIYQHGEFIGPQGPVGPAGPAGRPGLGGASSADRVSFAPSGSLSSTDVQSALIEIVSEKSVGSGCIIDGGLLGECEGPEARTAQKSVAILATETRSVTGKVTVFDGGTF